MIVDVTDADSITAARERVEEITGPRGLKGLVNNAGVPVGGPIEATSLETWRRGFDVNFFGAIAVTQAFLPMLRASEGRVVNMGSIGGRVALPYSSTYTSSKFALRAMTDALRMEMHRFGIKVSLIEPGSVATPIWDKAQLEAGSGSADLTDDQRRLYGEQIARFETLLKQTGERGIEPREVAEAVMHALTAPKPKSKYLVGRDAKVRALVTKFLPDAVVDRAILKQMKV